MAPFIDIIKNLSDDIAPRFKHLLKYKEVYEELQTDESLRKLKVREVAKLLEAKTGINVMLLKHG